METKLCLITVGGHDTFFHNVWFSVSLLAVMFTFPTVADFRSRTVGPIANLKGHYFQPSLSVCLSVCLWPVFLPFNVYRFWRNLVTRTLLWCSLAATIMVQIGRRETAQRLFENLKNSQKSHNSNFQILVHHFLRLCLLCIVKKFDSIWTKLTEEIHFEVCPYGHNASTDATPLSTLQAATCCGESVA